MARRSIWCFAIASILAFALLAGRPAAAQPADFQAQTIGEKMEAFWQGRAHFEEVRQIAWGKPPYSSPREGAGWLGNPMPFPDGKWYLFSRNPIRDKPSYCPGRESWEVVVRESSDQGRTWSNPATVVARPGPEGALDACGIFDGSSYYDRETNTWHMLAMCRAAQNEGGAMTCHYVRAGASPMGAFTPDPVPAVRPGPRLSQICAASGGVCGPGTIVNEGTPDIVFKKNGFFYVTFHGWIPPRGFRAVAKTRDFHEWVVAGPDLPQGPIFTPAQCQAWNPGCIGAGEASTLIASDHQYMLIETPSINLLCTPGQTWPIALLRGPKDSFPPASSPLWQPYRANPLLVTTSPNKRIGCPVQYPRWAVTGNEIYILYEDLGAGSRRLLKLVPGGGPAVILAVPSP